MTAKPALLALTALALVSGCNSGGGGEGNRAAAGNGTAANASAGANSTAPVAAPSGGATAGGPVDREFVVGHWGRAGDCSQTLSFNADGTATGGPAEPGSRWSLEGNTLSVTEPGRPPEPATVARNGDNLAVTAPGDQQMMLTRCPAAATSANG